MSAFDPKSPSVARLYDTALGGKDNYERDRDLVAELASITPQVKDIVAENRRFLTRVVTWLSEQGITQFLDLGCGMPMDPNVHETAHEVNPGARIAYVDIDPVAINHMNTFARPGSGVTAIRADASDHEAVRAALGDALDFTRPVAIIMCALLHFFDLATAREVVAAYAGDLAPGSYLTASVMGTEGAITEKFVRVFSAAVTPVHPLSAEDLAGLLGAFELVPPGVTPQELWRPGWGKTSAAPARDLQVHAVVARLNPESAKEN